MTISEGVFKVSSNDGGPPPAFLVFDTESVPDGKLISMVKYAGEDLAPEAAVERARLEARERSRDNSDFLPVTFQYPVAVCVLRVGPDFRLQALTCLDAPQFRTREMVGAFWKGVAHHHRAKLVTYNGRAFDLPLMELGAFRYGYTAMHYYQRSRNRFNGHIDLLDWLSNYGGCRLAGGLNLLSKMLGKPGKMGITGDQVYALYRAGKLQEINDYCMFDTIDTYFVFLRTRVLTGDVSLQQEQDLIGQTRSWLAEKANYVAALQQYLDHWCEWRPWP
jgi:predicted PolB exonuclease-like 3'-5' exonuclease